MGLCKMYEWFLAVVILHFKKLFFEVICTVLLSLSYIIMTYVFIFMLCCKNSTVSSCFFVILFQMTFITFMLSSWVYQGSTAHLGKFKLKAYLNLKLKLKCMALFCHSSIRHIATVQQYHWTSHKNYHKKGPQSQSAQS